MANIDIVKGFEDVEFVRDSAVCQVRANEFISTAEVIPYFDFQILTNDIPEHAGMMFEVNGIAISWVAQKYTQGLATMQDDYYAYIGDVPTSLLFTEEECLARIVNALKNHPNYAAFLEYAYIQWDGGVEFGIYARSSDVVLKRYVSFTDTIDGGATITYTHPNTSYFDFLAVGTLNTALTPEELKGAIAEYEEDFRLIVDVYIDSPGNKPVMVSENYYPDTDGLAEIDVAGIVTRYFDKEDFNWDFYRWNKAALVNVNVKISSYYNSAIQNNIGLSFKALNGYTGRSDKDKHLETIRKYFDDDVQFLTMLPNTAKISAAHGVLLQMIMKREVKLNSNTNNWNGWNDNTKLFITVYYKDSALAVEQIFYDFGIHSDMETRCSRFTIDKDFLDPQILQNWEDVLYIVVNMYNGGGIGSIAKAFYLDHKTTGDEQLFLFKNRFGVWEQLVAKDGTTESMEVDKLTAEPFKKWNAGSDEGNVVVYGNKSQSGGTVNIGYLGKEYKEFLKDFLNSEAVFIWKDELWVGVQIASESYDLESSFENMKSLEVEYSFNEIKRS